MKDITITIHGYGGIAVLVAVAYIIFAAGAFFGSYQTVIEHNKKLKEEAENRFDFETNKTIYP